MLLIKNTIVIKTIFWNISIFIGLEIEVMERIALERCYN
jgi:hypothetical protein